MNDEKESAAPESTDQSQASESAKGADARRAEKELTEIRKAEGVIVDPGEPGENPFQQLQTQAQQGQEAPSPPPSDQSSGPGESDGPE